MKIFKKHNGRRGFTLVELLVVVAVIAVISATALIFINPRDIDQTERNRNAESIAVAAQNRLTALRNAGEIDYLKEVGEPYVPSKTIATAAQVGETLGGYRYIFNYTQQNGALSPNPDMDYFLPFGAIELSLAEKYFAIGFQSESGMVGEVFWSENSFKSYSVEYLISLKNDAELRKADGVGYYFGETSDVELAFAQLPTPQLTISNYENLVLSIYLPQVKELEDLKKSLALRISLADSNDYAYTGTYEDKVGDKTADVAHPSDALTLDDTAIYRTYKYDESVFSQQEVISTGKTYRMILDTPDDRLNNETVAGTLCADSTSGVPASDANVLRGKFEAWAKKTKAFSGSRRYFKLGDNCKINVTVFCLDGEGAIDPTFMPRSATVSFNGWFDNYSSGKVKIACGRHLQNLSKLTALSPQLEKYLPEINEAGEYVGASVGKAYYFTYKGDEYNKYPYRDGVLTDIVRAEQVKAIDFDNTVWNNGKNGKIAFDPINLPKSFRYEGKYLTIKNLYVDAPFYAGLFGFAYRETFYDILLVNPSVHSRMPAYVSKIYEMGVGALIGTSRDSDVINNCQVYMEANSKAEYDTTKRISGSYYVGGLIGFCEDEHLENDSASVYTGSSDNSSMYVGGLVGAISGDSNLSKCYAAGNLSGQYVGGLIGALIEDSDNSGDDFGIEGCYTAGHIYSATKSAAGLVGRINEQGGYTKSALRAKGNYCAIVYGAGNGNASDWQCQLTDMDGKVVSDASGKPQTVPVYGTFEGDGFEWLNSTDAGYYTGQYLDSTLFFGAEFEYDNQNYYIPQRGITYSNSPYFEAMKQISDDLYAAVKDAGNDKNQILAALSKYRTLLRRQKQLMTLEKIKTEFEQTIWEMENETAKDSSGSLYSDGGYKSSECKNKIIYLLYNHADVTAAGHQESKDKYKEVTVLQALKYIYDGNGGELKITYERGGTEADKYVNGESGELINYTFMSLYDTVKTALQSNDEETLFRYLGEEYTDESGTHHEKTNGYQNGLLYKYFYSRLVNNLFDHAKDYYEDVEKGTIEIGRNMYYYFRDMRAKAQIRNLLNSMVAPQDDLEALLLEKKIAGVQEAIDSITQIKTVTNKWTQTSPMGEHKSAVEKLVSTASTDLSSLLGKLQSETPVSPSDLKTAAETAYASYCAIYKYIDDKKLSSINDYSMRYSDSQEKYVETSSGAMSGLRDYIKSFRSKIKRAKVQLNAGVEGAIDILEGELKIKSSIVSNAVNEFTKSLDECLGTKWEKRDSGHRIYSAKELTEIRRNHTISSYFEYDYNDIPGYNKPNSSYLYLDNGIYNNVFPYTEKGIYTKWYPFLMIKGLQVHGSADNVPPQTGVLFHYGDWLTEDLWEKAPATRLAQPWDNPVTMNEILESVSSQMQTMYNELKNVSDTHNAPNGQFGRQLTATTENIKKSLDDVTLLLSNGNEKQKSDLEKVSNVLSGWVAKDSDFDKLEDACKNSQSHTDAAQDVIGKLGTYRETVNAILAEIRKLLASMA